MPTARVAAARVIETSEAPVYTPSLDVPAVTLLTQKRVSAALTTTCLALYGPALK